MDSIQKLEQELKDLKYKKFQEEQIDKLKKESDWRKDNNIDVYGSDDYYGASMGQYSFYFGYEETICKKHPKKSDCEDMYDCDQREWCFTVTCGGAELMRIPESELQPYGDIDKQFVSGVMMFIGRYIE